MNEAAVTLLLELSRGAHLAFSNAQELFGEGQLLLENGSLNRALTLHQISLEECGKVEIIGAWATTVLLGGDINVPAMTKAFRSHKAKNYANAYFADLSAEERAARAVRDTAKAVEAFRRLRKQFHEDSNDAKNASLYVDFRDGRFVAPGEVITEDVVRGVQVVNAYFLDLTGPKVRMLERVAQDDGTLKRMATWFVERAEELRDKELDDPATAFGVLIQEFLELAKGSKS